MASDLYQYEKNTPWLLLPTFFFSLSPKSNIICPPLISLWGPILRCFQTRFPRSGEVEEEAEVKIGGSSLKFSARPNFNKGEGTFFFFPRSIRDNNKWDCSIDGDLRRRLWLRDNVKRTERGYMVFPLSTSLAFLDRKGKGSKYQGIKRG